MPEAEFWIGLEAGCDLIGESLNLFAWAVVITCRRLTSVCLHTDHGVLLANCRIRVLLERMARPKEFDETAVLGNALDLFRVRGFEHTSFEDLTEELGICRQSLYDTFGDKHALYQASLSRYLDQGLRRVKAVLNEDAPVKQTFTRLFDKIIAGHCDRGSPGCFMVNSMVELAPHDADIRALALKHASEMERMFSARISAAQRQGEISNTKDPAAIARFFYHILLGLSVAARALGERERLRETAQFALKELE